jgi:hypothetical protein
MLSDLTSKGPIAFGEERSGLQLNPQPLATARALSAARGVVGLWRKLSDRIPRKRQDKSKTKGGDGDRSGQSSQGGCFVRSFQVLHLLALGPLDPFGGAQGGKLRNRWYTWVHSHRLSPNAQALGSIAAADAAGPFAVKLGDFGAID